MKLTLTIQGRDRLDNGLPARLDLAERGAIIGRSPTVSWCLPDTSNHISSRHCEISFRDGLYVLTDTSTNGTFVNGRQLTAPCTLNTGDILTIGAYQISTEVEGQSAADGSAAAKAGAQPSGDSAWAAWDSLGGKAAPNPAPADDWNRPPPGAAISGTGSMSQNWAPPKTSEADPWGAPPSPTAQPAAPAGDWGPASSPASAPPSPPAPSHPSPSHPGPSPASGGWGPAAAPEAEPSWTPAVDTTSPWASEAPPPPPPASPWSSAIPDTVAAPQADDIWGKFAENHVVDWARGGFGQPAPTPAARDPLGLNKQADFVNSLPPVTPQWAGHAAPEPEPEPEIAPAPVAAPELPRTQAPVAAPAPTAPLPLPLTMPRPAPTSGVALDGFLNQLGLGAADLKASEAETLDASGLVLRRLVAGMVVLLEARARAKSQMGAQGTALTFEGNNPLKFARTPEQALAQLLNPPERGFMTADRAIEDAFLDLQSHQMATLRAMQGALKATLDRFSPSSIRERAESKGIMAKIFPDARDAALWKAYEREFSGVVQGSDEAFMDVFSKEFRKAYEDLTAKKTF